MHLSSFGSRKSSTQMVVRILLAFATLLAPIYYFNSLYEFIGDLIRAYKCGIAIRNFSFSKMDVEMAIRAYDQVRLAVYRYVQTGVRMFCRKLRKVVPIGQGP